MNYLAPSILAADFTNLGRDVKTACGAGAQYAHLDVMDGVFVPNISFGFPVIESLRKTVDCVFDVHLMIMQPERYVDRFAAAGADIITFHVESTDNPTAVIEQIHTAGKKAGVALKPATPAESVKDLLPFADMVLVMTVEPGFGGQKFMPDMLEKVRDLRDYRDKCGLYFDIEADGGITLGNVGLLLDSGVNVIVAGSSVYSENKTAENTAKFIERLK